MDTDTTDVLAVHAIPVIVQEEDVVCPAPNCETTGTSRPSSQLSQNGSSGYGSTRSQVGPFGASNRPSPASSTSSTSKTAKAKRSVWFGNSGGSLRAVKPPPEQSEPPIAKTRGGPQYASLRIPNRIRHHSSEHFEDRGLDLAEAEVDSDVDERNLVPNYPLRHASSLEAQVSPFFYFQDYLEKAAPNFHVSSHNQLLELLHKLTNLFVVFHY